LLIRRRKPERANRYKRRRLFAAFDANSSVFLCFKTVRKGDKNVLYLPEVTMPSRPISHTDIAELTRYRPLLESLALSVGVALTN
jgi:hypothetical protein